MKQIIHKHINYFKSASDFLYANFRNIMILIAIIMVPMFLYIKKVPTLELPFSIIIVIVFVIMIPNFVVKKGFESIYNLVSNEKITIKQIIRDYAIAVVSVIFFFTLIYGITEASHVGYLKYGSCNSNELFEDIKGTDTYVSPLSRMYFSAITFFTVGYGDICPMGYDKLVSVINAFMGSLINILIISIAIGQYLRSGKKGKNIER